MAETPCAGSPLAQVQHFVQNLGIERLIENVVANTGIRRVVLCGADTAGKVGHFPGQSLLALVENGVDDKGRIIGAKGKRPVLKNVDPERVARFREQVVVVDRRGVEALGELRAVILFGTLAALALAGIHTIDAKTRARNPLVYQVLEAETSRWPFAAILAGRQSLGAAVREIGWPRLAVALVLYAAILHLHPWAFGVYAIPTTL